MKPIGSPSSPVPAIAVICLALVAVLAATTVGGLGQRVISRLGRSAAQPHQEVSRQPSADAGAAPQPTVAAQPTVCTEKSCQATAAWLGRQLGESYRVLIRVPFVVAGEAGDDDLARWYEQVLASAADGMSACYFRTPPHEPITLVRCPSEEEYRRISKRLCIASQVSSAARSGHRPKVGRGRSVSQAERSNQCDITFLNTNSQTPPSDYGYYHPHLRIILLNAGPRSDSAARHELTHALMDFDFPKAPAWLCEGLAAMHEAGQFGIRNAGFGRGNAKAGMQTSEDLRSHRRWPVLHRALSSCRLPSLASLLALKDLHDDQQSLHYAEALYFCLYLQEQELLEPFYHRLRSAAGSDPTGEKTLLDLVPDRSCSDWEAAFRAYLATIQWSFLPSVPRAARWEGNGTVHPLHGDEQERIVTGVIGEKPSTIPANHQTRRKLWCLGMPTS